MQPSAVRSLNIMLCYPFTWAALLLLLLVHGVFTWWFAPSAFVQAVALLLDVGCFGLFVVSARASTALQRFAEQRTYRAAMQRLATGLPEAAAEFRDAALACLTLSQQLHRNFKDEPSLHAFEAFLQNIITMTDNYRVLFTRAQQFGTAAQKTRMQTLLARQGQAMQQTLESLQAFSGHLTIMSAQLERSALVARELQFMNQGLQEVIQEMADA